MISLLSGVGRRVTEHPSPEIGTPTGILVERIYGSERTSGRKLGPFAIVAKKGSFHLVDSPSSSKLEEISYFLSPFRPQKSAGLYRRPRSSHDTNRLLPQAFRVPLEKGQKPYLGGFRARVQR